MNGDNMREYPGVQISLMEKHETKVVRLLKRGEVQTCTLSHSYRTAVWRWWDLTCCAETRHRADGLRRLSWTVAVAGVSMHQAGAGAWPCERNEVAGTSTTCSAKWRKVLVRCWSGDWLADVTLNWLTKPNSGRGCLELRINSLILFITG